MLKKLFFIVSAFILSIPALADGTLVNGIYYKFSGTEATVTSNPNKYSGSVTIPEKVTYNNKEYSVTAIDFQAFANCSSLTSITIPNSVTSIGNYAFNGSSNLTSITIPNSITSIGPGAFENTGWYNNQPDGVVYIGKVLYKYKGTMPNNTEITIEEGTLNIAYEAFYGCSGLTSINIPNSVTRIEARVFMDCTGLTSITIPNGVTSIGSSTFSGCSGLTSITIPNTITTTGSKTFERCTGLTSITIPEGVTAIGSSTFSGCSGLTSITIPNSVTTIVSGAFSGCSGLTSIVIPNSVTTIDEYAFSGCSGLTSIVIPNGVPYISEATFRNCSNLSSITIPEGITSIGEEAFYGCSSLNSITIPNSVERIGDKAFEGCSGLTSITIPNTVKSICIASFKNCSSLLSVTIPSNISLIYKDAFSGCSELQNIYSYALTPIEIPENVFPTNNGSTILHVPAGTKSAYLNTAGWSKFGESNIVEFTISSGQVDGIYYQFSESEASVKSNPQKYTGSVTIPSSVKHQGKTYNVTSISDNAFESCSGLTSVVIPNSVTSIGKEAFEGCSSLAEINIPDGVTSIAHQTFKNCNSLTAIVIPENVTGIAYEAFKGCSELTAITIPNSVRGIGNEAFEGCSSLAEINIPTGITSIGDQTFHDCSSLTAITIPDGVTSIGEEAFKGCLSLTSITIPKSVTYIRKCAFNQCPSLTTLNVEFGNTKYDSRGNCNAIINTETNSLIFGTKNTIIPHDVSSIGDYAFYDCTSLTSITIPNSVTSIGYIAFHGCTGLTSITIPSSVTSIGNNAFQSCTGLASITIPSSITSIGANVFYKCTGLTSITIPNSVTSITSGAFEDCSSLTSVTVERDTPEAISGSVFTNRANATLYVPTGAKAAYQAADYWKEFKEIIEMKAEGPVRVINVTTAGTLSSLISDEDKFNITDLTITGQLNGTDFRLLREMAGNDFTGHPTEGKLEKLDLSGATIVAGGNYAEFENNLCNLGDERTVSAYISEFIDNSLPECLFLGCSKLQEIKLPSSIVAIQTGAFRHTGLTSFVVPKSTETLKTHLFTGCDNLISLDVESGNTTYWAKDNAIIETSTNRLVVACKNTTIPSEVLIIGQNAFYNSGETIVLPSNLNKIESSAFSGTSLKNIIIPASVSEIEGGAFTFCDDLIGITVDAGNTKYESPEGSNAIIEKTTKTLVAGCQSTVIPSDVTAIGAGAFLNNINKNSTSITLPASITSIGREAFYSCAGLSINLPTSITSIDELTFSYNSNLTVTVESTTPLSINENVFQGLSNSTLRVPAGCKSVYAAATGWKNFGTILEGNEGSTFTAKTTEGIDMVFTILDESAKTCQVGYLDGSWDKTAVDKNTVNGAVTIPNTANGYKVVKIGRCALNNIVRMTSASVTIPESVTTIDENAFAYNSNLTVTVESTTPLSINENVFQGLSNSTLRVPAGCKSAYAEATGWKNFGTILEGNEGSTFTAKTTEGIDMVFTILDESDLTCQVGYLDGSFDKTAVDKNTVNGAVTIPNTANGYKVVKIGKCAFQSVNGMKTVTIPNTVTSIDELAFQGCGLTSFVLPKNVTYLGRCALSPLANVTSVKVEEGNTKYDSRDNCNAIIETATNILQFGYGISTIPASVKELGVDAFFSLYDCTLTIPSTITRINEYAFSGCQYLNLQVAHTDPLVINGNVFQGLGNSTLRVPAGSKSVYAAATGWKNFGTILEGNEGSTFTAKTTEGIDMVFTILDESAKICQVGYLDGSPDKTAVDKDAVNGPVTIPETVKGYTVVEIGKYAFYYVSDMASVTIPNTVTSIEEFAFSCCYGLTSFELPTSITNIGRYAFSGCVMQSSITIPNSVTSIGEFAFKGCLNLTSVTVEAETPLTITEGVFTNINEDAKLYVPAGSKAKYAAATGWKDFNEIIEMEAQTGNIVFASPEVKAACVAKWDGIVDGVKDGELSYAEAAAVTSLVDPTDIEDPFALLTDVESDFTFDEFQYFTGVTSLTNYDFDEFEHLTSIVLPNSIQSIECGAFYDCKLTSIHIPASVTDISDTYINESVIEVLYTPAFSSSFLQTITVDPGNTRYSSPTGSNVIIDKTSNTLIMGCRNTDFSKIPNTVTTIAMRAFEGVEFANPAVNLPTSVKAIKSYAFEYSNIISINLGELTQLTEIGLTAFKECDGLTEVTLPASITTMERAIFAGCDNLVKVVSNREEPLANNNNNFDPDHIIAIYNNAVLYVPSGKVEAYTNAGWEEPFDDDLKSFRVITDGDHTDPEAIEGLAYNGSDQKLILPGTYRTGMMEYSLDGSIYSTSVPTGKEAGEYTVYYRKVGLSDASILKVTIAAPKTISVFSGSNLWAGYVATENLAIPTGLEAYVITNLGATTATASSLNYIPQGVPVLLKRNNASVNDYEISTGTGTAPTVNLLKTYDSDKSVSNREGFILYNDEFVLVNEGTLPAGRVFLPANGSGRALTRTIVFDRDDIVDFGDSQENNDDSNQWYDIQGRKLERKPTKKGIYILDGRKVVIK